jgi:hypothetical protein
MTENIEIVVAPPRKGRASSWSTFERRYDPIVDPSGTVVRSWNDPAVLAASVRQVWTVVDAEGHLYVVPGLATVNYIGRIITRKGWSDVELTNTGYRF